MKKKFLRQIAARENEPMGTRWARIKAESPQEAALKKLDLKKIGTGTVYIRIGPDEPDRKWPNGLPMWIHQYEVDILSQAGK